MKYTNKVAEKSTISVTFEFDGEEWKKAQQDAYLKNRGRFTVNGFRKGKAPKNVIENVYGKGVFYDEALNTMFSDAYATAAEELSNTYVIVGEPEVTVEKLEDDGVTMTAIVPVKPEVKISSYKGMKIKEFAYTVSDAEVDKSNTP